MTWPLWLDRVWAWMHPHEKQIAELSRKRSEIVADAQITSLTVRLQSYDLRQETKAQKDRYRAEMGPITQLLSQMDKRHND